MLDDMSSISFSFADSDPSDHCPGHGPGVECCIEWSWNGYTPDSAGYDYAEIQPNEYV